MNKHGYKVEKTKNSYLIIKRLMDIVGSVIALILFSPLMIVVAILIKAESEGPVFFKQRRIGKGKREFYILKFRSMKQDAPKEVPTHLLDNPYVYITRIGKFIRKTSIDELPQFINVLRGEMSLVGPRPALWNQNDLISERDKYGVNDVHPGITGLAQITGRDELTIGEKAYFDGQYIKEMSLAVDLKCIITTIINVIRGKNVTEGGKTNVQIYNSVNRCMELLNENQHKKKAKTLVSVIIPTFRRDNDLKNALASLKSQDYPQIEIIVVDDNAEPIWNKIVKKTIDTIGIEEIVYLKNETNIGPAASRNLGIKMSSGEYITFLDDDDVYYTGKISNQLYNMILNEADFSITEMDFLNEEGKISKRNRNRCFNAASIKQLHKYHIMYHLTGTSALMFKSNYIREIGGFSEIDLGDEYYLVEKAILKGGKFIYLPFSGVVAKIHSKSEGLSTGNRKISGENDLYKHKLQYFNELTCNEKRYVTMRHYAVLGYVEIKRGNFVLSLTHLVKAFFIAPISFVDLIMQYI